jgi:hypothetical protein
MPATGDRITKRKDGLFQGMYMAKPRMARRGSIFTAGSTATSRGSWLRRWATRPKESTSTMRTKP